MSRIALTLLLAGCSELALQGTVVDAHGMPLAGVLVSTEPGRCAGTTNAQGIYYARCKPGSYTLIATLDNHYTASLPVSVDEAVTHSMPQMTLYPQPSGSGLWWLIEAVPTVAPRATVERRQGDKQRRYCLATDAADGLPVPSGAVQLIETDSAAWRLFRLDDDGCARHETWAAGDWRVLWEDPISSESSPVGDAQLHAVSLTPGDYLLVPWSNQRFVVDETQTAAAGDKRYVAHRITAN